MTFRAVVLGVLGAAFIAAFGYINDAILYLTPLVGNHFPIFIFGLLILVVMLLNPLLFRLRRSWRFRPGEMAVIAALMLAACSVPSNGLMRTFHTSLAMPLQYYQQSVDWRTHKILSYVPPCMMPSEPGAEQVAYSPAVMDDFLTTHPEGRLLDWSRVPWRLWARSTWTWGALIFLTGLGVICMSLMVHNQWANRERLRYPIAAFAASLTQQDPDSGVGPIFRSKLFWLGLIVVFLIRLSNGINTWIPQSIGIPLEFPLTPILQKWPHFGRAAGDSGFALITIRIFPTVVAFAFFLSADVALSLGLSQVFFVFGVMVLVKAGVRLESDYFTGGAMPWQLFGSCLGMAALLIYIGRRYYWLMVKRAITFGRQREVTSSAAWACRLFFLTIAGLTIFLSVLGLNWPFALLIVLMIMLIYLVVARINAESGLFFIQPSWMPLAILIALFGANAVGPKAMVVAGLVTAVLVIDPRESLMPYITTGLKMTEDAGIRPAKLGWSSIGIFAMALAIAFPVVLAVNYNSSEPRTTKWSFKETPKLPFDAAVREMTKLSISDELAESKQMTTWERLRSPQPNPRFFWYGGAGLALVLGFSFLRLRFAWWPLHPIMFLVWGTWPMGRFSHSFLLGWLIKTAVTKLGSGIKHRQVMALMIGVIAGDLLGGMVFMAFGAGYHAITGLIPKKYVIFPG